MSEAVVNSRAWWDEYFVNEWEEKGGPEQSRHFMEMLLKSLPAREGDFLRSNATQILDWGCAFGEGVDLLAKAFPAAKVEGLDFSEHAIATARQRFPEHEFISTPDGALPRDFDVIVTSNCLEHFEKPLEIVNQHLPHCRLLYMALVPYNEHPFDPQHRAQFREESFPERLGGFRRVHVGLVQTDPKFWAAPELLAIYASPAYLLRVLDPGHEPPYAQGESLLADPVSAAGAVEGAAANSAALRRLRDEIAARTADVLALYEELHALQLRFAERDKQAALLSAKVTELHGWSEALQNRLNERDRLIALVDAREQELATRAAALDAQAQRAEQDAQRARAEWLQSSTAAEAAALEVQAVRTELERVRAEMDATRRSAADLADAVQHSQSERDAARAAAMTERRAQEGALTALLAELDQTRTDKDALQESLRNADSGHADRGAQLAELQRRLDDIHGSTGWKVLQPAYKLRYALFPPASRRERVGKWIMHKRRRAAFFAQQGPAALFGAAGRYLRRIATRTSLPRPHAAAARTALADGTGADPLDRPLVSVVLPVYNQADLLAESIESVLAQTYENFELIVVNDGSRDEVERVLEQYVGHAKVRVLTQANQKLPKALSNGFDFARGELWTWTSADNLMAPQQLERQVAFLNAHPRVGMVYSDYLAIDDRGGPLQDANFRPQNRSTPADPAIHLPRDVSRLNTVQDNFIGACFLYRGTAGRLLGDYTPILGVEDYDYWMRMNALFGIQHLGTDELLYRYRVHDNTLNARASEHHIYERVQRLMYYEQARHSYFQRPWKIYVDDATQAWLGTCNTSGHTIQRLGPQDELRSSREEILIIVRADALPMLRGRTLPKECCIAVWFEDDALLPYRYSEDLQRIAHMALAADARTIARLQIFTRQAFRVAPGQAAFDLIRAFAVNSVFARKTLPAEDCARHSPQVFQPAGRTLRVLIQVENFDRGGLERVVLDLAAVLDSQNFEPMILVLAQEGEAARQARAAGLPVLTLPHEGREDAYRSLLRDRKIDLVNAHYSLFGAGIADELSVPFVQSLHNTYVWAAPEDIAAYRAADGHTRAYLCVSALVAWHAEQRLGIAPEKLLIAPNGIDLETWDQARAAMDRSGARGRLGCADEDFVVLCVASVTNVKGQLHLVRALAEARRRAPRLKLMLLGSVLDQDYERLVREEIRRLDLVDRVVFLGHHEDSRRFYFAADAFALPSFVEGWSIALAEAIYAGLPVIATEVGAARELLTLTGGKLITPPFRSMLDYDHRQFFELTRENHPEFVRRLADALAETVADPEPPAVSDTLRRSVDRRTAYSAHAAVFQWLALNGVPAGIRPMMWDVHGLREHDQHLTSKPLAARRRSSRRGSAASAGGNGRAATTATTTGEFSFVAGERSVAQVIEHVRNSRGAVIFVQSIDWSQWLFQRPHHLARYFADRGYVTIYDDSGRFTGFAGFKEIEPNLYLFRGPADLLHRIPQPLLWTFCYNFQLKDRYPPGQRVVYDLIDDFAVHPYDPVLMARNHERAIREAAVVAFVARKLAPMLEARPDRLYLPNGVEDEFFADASIRLPHDPQMRRILKQGKPIAGYYGALAEWFDYALLERTARLRPDWNFVLIGPKYDQSFDNQPMLKLSNVHWLGPRDYAVLPAYLRAFDVATIPFAINDITLATSPLKLYEYFAGGKPVIASPMPECVAFPEVLIVRGAAEYSAALDEARRRQNDPQFAARLRQLARENSWEQRVQAVENLLEHSTAARVGDAVAAAR